MFSIGTDGLSVKYSLPQRPFSSPLTITNIKDRRGRGCKVAKASAASSTAMVPEASSSAPLYMLSPFTGFPTPT